MKKHFLKFLILIATFTLGLVLSPIRFDGTGMGHGMVDDNGIGSYWIHGYKSMYFVSLSNEGENFKTSERAIEVFKQRLQKPEVEEISHQEVLEPSETRAIIHFQRRDNLEGYCVLRVEKNSLQNICSTSLWHVLDFERQNY